MTKKLLSEIKINKIITFQNRVAMSAMTRGFADNNHCATKDILNYYERRAKSDVGLIITEGIIIHPSADGYNSESDQSCAIPLEGPCLPVVPNITRELVEMGREEKPQLENHSMMNLVRN